MQIQTSMGALQIFGIADDKFGRGIGTRVKLGRHQFCQEILAEAFKVHDISTDRAPGQHFVELSQLSEENLRVIFGNGIGLRTQDPTDYFPALWRGQVSLFGLRKLALDAERAAVIVYERDAFLADPEVTEENRRWLLPDTKYVLIDILAFNAVTPLTPERFVSNLGGGNNAYLPRAISERLVSELPVGRFAAVGPEEAYRVGARDAVLYMGGEALAIHQFWFTHVVVGDPQ